MPSLDSVVDRTLQSFGVLVYAFLYAPILVVVIYAFNESREVQVWEGLGLRYWASTWSDATIRNSLVLSLWTAALNAVLATVLGTGKSVV